MSEDELMNTPISDLNEEQIQQGIKKIQEEIREGASAWTGCSENNFTIPTDILFKEETSNSQYKTGLPTNENR